MGENATLKALGFGPGFVGGLIVAESLMMSVIGGALGILLTFPLAAGFKALLGTMFPVFNVSGETVVMQALSAITVGLLAGLLPALRASRVKIVDGLRYVG